MIAGLIKNKVLVNPKKIFFGWWITLSGGLLCLWGFAYHAYGFSALLKPLSRELGFTRAQTSLAASIARFEGGLDAALVGYLADRYGPRTLVFVGVFLTGLGLILMNYVNSLWSFYLVWSIISSIGINISLGMPLDVAITNWFIKKRGTAMSIRWVFSGLSGVIGLPIVAWLIVTVGWRMACVIGGLVMWGVGLPLVYFFIKARRPEYYGLLPDGAAMEPEDLEGELKTEADYAVQLGEVEFTTVQALKTSAFWLMISAYMFHAALYPVMNIHIIPFLTDRGMEPLRAAATMSIFVTASIPARFLGGVVVDRVRTSMIRYLMAGAFFMQAVAVAIFLFNQQSMFALYVFFIVYGIGMGASLPMSPVLQSRYFGRPSFGTIAGISRVLNMPVGIMGPVLAGWIYDRTGSYILAFTLFAVTLALAGVLMCFVRRPESPPPKNQAPEEALPVENAG